MPTYSRPPAPRPSGRTPTPVPKLTAYPAPIRGSQPQQAQGRDVVNQGGQQGVMSDRGKFQPLGNAALSKLPATTSAPAAMPQPKLMPSAPMFRGGADPSQLADVMQPYGTGPGSGSGAGDIESAIQGLKSQLGEPTDAAINKMAGFGPNVQSTGPAIQTALAGASGGNPNSAPGMPPDVASRLRSMIGGGLQAPGRGGMTPFGGGGRRAGRAGGGAGGGTGFMPGQPNPYAEILRQRMNPAAGAVMGAAAGGLGGGPYAY